MAIFSRITSAARTFGQRVFGTAKEAENLRREAGVQKAREEAARREALDIARQARELSNPRARAGASTRAAEQAAQEQKRKLLELARRERLAREEQARARARAEELRRKADNMEREAARLEASKNKAREAYLRTRKNLTPEDWDNTFAGPRPVAPRIDKNRKEVGVGLLPEEKMFLYLRVPLSRFASSNVQELVYDAQGHALYAKYIKSQRWYKYSGVPLAIGKLAYSAVSRGVFIWDSIRVRGTRNGHHFAVTRGVEPPPPIDPTSSEGMAALNGVGL